MTTIAWLNFFVLFLTLIVIVCYTVITNKLHRTSLKHLEELIRERRLSVIPALLPRLVRQGDGTHMMSLTNMGNGVAVNIKLDKVEHAISKMMPNTYYKFEKISMLRPGESTMVTHKSYVSDAEMELAKDGLLIVLSEEAKTTTELRITFQNLESEQYEEKFQMGKDGSKFISLNFIGVNSTK